MGPTSAFFRDIAKLLPKKEISTRHAQPRAVQHPSNSLLGLPLELLHHILYFLQLDRKALLCASSVHSGLRALVLPLLVASVSISASRASITLLQQIIPNLSSFLLLIKELDVRGDDSWVLKDAAVKALLHCRAVTSLTIHHPIFYSRGQLDRLISGYPELKKLHMAGWPRSITLDWRIYRRNPQKLRLQMLTLTGERVGGSAHRQDVQDSHHFSFSKRLRDAKVMDTLKDVYLWCTDPLEFVVVQNILSWNMPHAQTCILDTVGSGNGTKPVTEQLGFSWIEKNPFTSSNPYTALGLRLGGVVEEVTTAITLLQYIKIPTLRVLNLLFDATPETLSADAAALPSVRKLVFKPEPGKPSFDPAPFPALESIGLTFRHVSGVHGAQHIRDRFARATARGVIVTVVMWS